MNPGESPAAAAGTLSFVVRRPVRSAQAVPVAANLIRVRIFDDRSSELGRVDLVRPDSNQSVPASGPIQLQPGSDLRVVALACGMTNPSEEDEALAQALCGPDRAGTYEVRGAALVSGFDVLNGVPSPGRIINNR